MDAKIYTLKNGNLEMTVTDYGARVLSLLVPDKNGVKADVAVGYATLEEYIECPGERFFGASVGRLANRLGGASFVLDGKEYKLSANDNGNTLHGGMLGFDRVMWQVKEVQPDSILFSLREPDGQDGWPGNLDVEMRYSLTEDNAFKVEYKAVTDAPTLCNLTHHTFFNLTGDATESILDHNLQISAQSYIPVDDTLIPTGEVRSVEGTPFDFQSSKPIGQDIEAAGGYDHNWCLTPGCGVRQVARLSEPKSGRIIGHRCALALETQAWPDAIHHPNFPDTILRPGQTYTQTCIYRFTV